MSSFEQRWQRCTNRARQATPREAAAPPGFATRVAACSRTLPVVGLQSLWERLALGSLVTLLALLAVCVALEGPHLRDPHPWNPGIENVVAQLVWRL